MCPPQSNFKHHAKSKAGLLRLRLRIYTTMRICSTSSRLRQSSVIEQARLRCSVGLIQTFTVGLIRAFAVLTMGAVAAGDTVWVNGQAEPLCGRIVSRSDDEIQLEQFEDGKFGEITSIPTKQVDTVIVNFDPERLASLSPDNPVAYRNYAEELCTQRADAAAIHLARRLYLLAGVNAANSSQNALRSGAILGLISLAPDESQRRKLELLYRLNEPGQTKLKPKSKLPLQVNDAPTRAEQELILKVVVAIRQEDSDTAIGLLRSDQNRESIKKWSNLCTPEELDRIAAASRPSTLQLRKLLSVELAVRQPELTNSKPAMTKSGWDELAMQPATQFSALPTFANVTQFDPSKSVYRNGIWVRP